MPLSLVIACLNQRLNLLKSLVLPKSYSKKFLSESLILQHGLTDFQPYTYSFFFYLFHHLQLFFDNDARNIASGKAAGLHTVIVSYIIFFKWSTAVLLLIAVDIMIF